MTQSDQSVGYIGEEMRGEMLRVADAVEPGLFDLLLYYGAGSRITCAQLAERLARRVASDLEADATRFGEETV